jgi:hypothetical protein
MALGSPVLETVLEIYPLYCTELKRKTILFCCGLVSRHSEEDTLAAKGREALFAEPYASIVRGGRKVRKAVSLGLPLILWPTRLQNRATAALFAGAVVRGGGSG